MNDEAQPNGNDIDAEFKALIEEQTGQLANDAADASLMALALLGAYKGPITLAFKTEVTKAFVRVMLAMSAVRMCLEASVGEMTDGERMGCLTRLVSVSFGIDDPEEVLRELVAESIETA